MEGGSDDAESTDRSCRKPFESDLEEEAELVNDDLPGVAAVYPVPNLGFSSRP